MVEEADEELNYIAEKARIALGREDYQEDQLEEDQLEEDQLEESYIEKIKNARPLEFESVQEDYEAENQSSFEEELAFEPHKVDPGNFEMLKSKINEKLK